ncbi:MULTISPECIES: ABC transporter substrate-binding protein [Paenibacillus]|uniref:Solute-binding protein family 5 domain-containing protein n=1 Tax=Paenibacillus odorifer TaxID=189426 RepID=A0ABX3GYC2_9BACL|nr:ABC transporter substrate-binding protein [Paenibacillus odorifer]OMD40569.1 hypothetical protein BSO21_00810 [Paenibacillus odorifer]
MKKGTMLLMIMAVMMFLYGCSSSGSNSGSGAATGNSESNSGGAALSDELRIAYPTQPSTLDPQMVTGGATKDAARPIFETLLTLNSKYQVVPMLSESWDKSEDGLVYTFQLREGIHFHNGKEMTSSDVVASMNRWITLSTAAQGIIGDGRFTTDGDYTVVLTLNKPSLDVLLVMATYKQFPAIMPAEVIKSADPSSGIKAFIGTGPYKFVEWKQDQYISYTRNDDYQPLDTEADGLGGKKVAEVKDIRLSFVSEDSTRMIGLQSGEYDVASQLGADNYDSIKDDSSLNTTQVMTTNISMNFNKKQGLFTDLKMRQAVNAALNIDDIFMANPGIPEFYRIDQSYMLKEQSDWYVEPEAGLFNQKDPEKAKSLLAEAGYNGEEIRLLATREYGYIYDQAVVIKDQLEKAGMNINLVVYDWPTLVAKLNESAEWDLNLGGYTSVVTPSQISALNPNYYGWTNDPAITEGLSKMNAAASEEEEQAIWKDVQQTVWDYLPTIKLGDLYTLTATTSKVEGYHDFEGIVLWNTKVYK